MHAVLRELRLALVVGGSNQPTRDPIDRIVDIRHKQRKARKACNNFNKSICRERTVIRTNLSNDDLYTERKNAPAIF